MSQIDDPNSKIFYVYVDGDPPHRTLQIGKYSYNVPTLKSKRWTTLNKIVNGKSVPETEERDGVFHVDKTNILYPRPSFPHKRGQFMAGETDGTNYQDCLNFIAAGNGDTTLNTELNSPDNDLVIDDYILSFNGNRQHLSYKCNNTKPYDEISRRLSSGMSDVGAASALLEMASAAGGGNDSDGGFGDTGGAAGGAADSGFGATMKAAWNRMPSLSLFKSADSQPPISAIAKAGDPNTQRKAARAARAAALVKEAGSYDGSSSGDTDSGGFGGFGGASSGGYGGASSGGYGGASKSDRHHPYRGTGGGRKYSSKKSRKNKSRKNKSKKNKSRTKKRKYRTRRYKTRRYKK